jgi:hypothetical protein
MVDMGHGCSVDGQHRHGLGHLADALVEAAYGLVTPTVLLAKASRAPDVLSRFGGLPPTRNAGQPDRVETSTAGGASLGSR